jgi:hypothetical protein
MGQSDNRYSADFQKSLVCVDENGGRYEMVNFHSWGEIGDTGILEVTETATGEQTLFFKSVLNVCIVDEAASCNEVNDGRMNNTLAPYVRLSGMVASCTNPTPQYQTLIVYPEAGQTLVELQAYILDLCGRL